MNAFADNEGPRSPHGPRDGDGRAQAALLLVESLMHSLLAKGVLSQADFIEIVEGAAEVENELLAANAWLPPANGGSFLSPISSAFKIELGQ